MATVWLEAARPRTLPAAVAPVVVGTAAASRFIAWRFVAALVVALAVQVAVNYANDYFDGVRGVDTAERIGPRRAVAAGLVAPSQMRAAIVAALVVAAAAGLALAVAVGWELVIVGALAFVAALGYSGGPRPYASAGLGEVSVFVFFGLVATVGSQYVQDDAVGTVAAVAAVPVGFLATAILVANNLRDVATDAAAGKRTLAVRMGEERTRSFFGTLLAGAFLGAAGVALVARSPWPLVALLAVPLAVRAQRTIGAAREPGELIPLLAATARLELVFALLLAVGLWIA